MRALELQEFLDAKVKQYNQRAFIENDPICIPHQFTKAPDIEIAAFFAAILAWGQRKTIINKCQELMQIMDHAPHQFVLHHSDQDLKSLLGFKHRTFNDTDLLYFISFFKQHYQQNSSLESAFFPALVNEHIEACLNRFRAYFFSLEDFPPRTQKHISSPLQKSTCKRLNMFLRWMVRKDNQGVDFGIWSHIPARALICPCDVHVDRVARELGLISRKQTDWLTALELTAHLRLLDPLDPVKYDFALFGLGVEEKFGRKSYLL